MTKAQKTTLWESKINRIVKAYKRLDEACDKADECGTLATSGKLFEAIWNAFEEMLRMIDHEGWIAWYIYDNDCGAKGYTASNGKKKTKPINKSRDLAKLIVERIED